MCVCGLLMYLESYRCYHRVSRKFFISTYVTFQLFSFLTLPSYIYFSYQFLFLYFFWCLMQEITKCLNYNHCRYILIVQKYPSYSLSPTISSFPYPFALDLDYPIALWKVFIYCSHLSRFVSYDKLTPLFHQFALSLSYIFVLRS